MSGDHIHQQLPPDIPGDHYKGTVAAIPYFSGVRVLLAFLLLLSASYARAQTACFKQSNNSELTVKSGINFGAYNVFFLGELHGVKGTSEVKLAMIKYLNTEYGITDVFMEIGFSAAYLYNKYLETGDTTYFTQPVLALAYRQPNRDFWKGLYTYNKTLRKKITIYGMDFERKEYARVLAMLAPKDKPIPADLPLLNAAREIAEDPGYTTGREADSLYSLLRKDISRRHELYAAYYGDNVKQLMEIVFNVNTAEKYGMRNGAMHENIIRQAEGHSIDRFMVIAGLNHANISDPQSVCGRLMNTRIFSGKVASIGMLCRDCYDRQRKKGEQQQSYIAPYSYATDTSLLSRVFTSHSSEACKYIMVSSAATASPAVAAYSHFLILMQQQGQF